MNVDLYVMLSTSWSFTKIGPVQATVRGYTKEFVLSLSTVILLFSWKLFMGYLHKILIL
jgi:hypothetical protein